MGKGWGFLLLGLILASVARAKPCESYFGGGQPPLVFRNPQVAAVLGQDLDAQKIYNLVDLLLQNDTFKMQISEAGFVAAADVGDHPDNYGKYFWLRDMARVYSGSAKFKKLLSDLQTFRPSPRLHSALSQARADSRKLALGLIHVLSDPKWTDQAAASILDPSWHQNAQTGYKNVIWVRRLLAPFVEGRLPTPQESAVEAEWGHKQNDALALFAHAVLDALNNGDLLLADFNDRAKANFVMLPAYFLRLRYWQMWDVGAWEESSALHTSSFTIVTSFMERFNQGFNNSPLPGETRPESNLFTDLQLGWDESVRAVAPKALELIEDALLPQDFEHGIDAAYAVLNPRLLSDHLVESDQGEAHSQRGEDVAILHGLLYPLQRYSDKEFTGIGQNVASLKRPWGYSRYSHDWFLHGASASAHAVTLGLVDRMAVKRDPAGDFVGGTANESNHLASEYASHVGDKDMSHVEHVVGDHLEAEWTLADALLAAYFARAGNLQASKAHFLRLAAMLTGVGERTLEGEAAAPLRMPEAYIPVRVMSAPGATSVEYFISPNSPLNWATAEFESALHDLFAALMGK